MGIRGAENFSSWTKKSPKCLQKKFSSFWLYFGTLQERQSPKMAILGPKSHIFEFEVAENVGGRSGVAEKFWIWTTKLHKFLQKKFWVPNSILNLRSEKSRGGVLGV